jgi:molybdopterin synthase sulfur carrier subunit
MKVTIKYFASIREALGKGSEQRDTAALTLADLRDELLALSPAHAQALARGKPVRMALDQLMSDESAPLRDGCEVAFFPPVTGG